MTANWRSTLGFIFLALIASCSFWIWDGTLAINHEGLTNIMRVEVYRDAFSHGVLYPVWNMASNQGFGSPFPFFYHKLIFWLSGFLAFFLGSYLGFIGSILGFLILGAAGMQKLSERLGLGAKLSFLTGALWLFMPYTYMDWFRRGAIAEFSAAAVLPWMIWVFLGRRRFREGIYFGLLFSALYYAHSIIAFYGFLFLLPAILWNVRAQFRALLGALLAVVITLLPHLFLVKKFSAKFWLNLLHEQSNSVDQHFHPLREHLGLVSFAWDVHPNDYSVVWGPFILLGLVLGGLGLTMIGAKNLKKICFKNHKIGLYFAFIFLICVFLQTRLGLPFYQHVPGANYIQFPYRLNVFITLILCVAYVSLLSLILKLNRPVQKVVGLTLWIFFYALQIGSGLNSQFSIASVYYPVEVERALKATPFADQEKRTYSRAMNWVEYQPAVNQNIPAPRPLIEPVSGLCKFSDPEVLTTLKRTENYQTEITVGPIGCIFDFNQVPSGLTELSVVPLLQSERSTFGTRIFVGEGRVHLKFRAKTLLELLSEY